MSNSTRSPPANHRLLPAKSPFPGTRAPGAPAQPSTPASAVPVSTELSREVEKIWEEISKASPDPVSQTRTMHRFPQSLREMDTKMGKPGPMGNNSVERYVVPSVVAIGPYHHRRPHLQAMERVKRAAALQFCHDILKRPAKQVYLEVLGIAEEARRCYTTNGKPHREALVVPNRSFAEAVKKGAGDDGWTLVQQKGSPQAKPPVPPPNNNSCRPNTNDDYDDVAWLLSLSHAKFAAMMFLDGCFLLNFIMLQARNDDHMKKSPLMGHKLSCEPTITKDILMLENQIPWRVLQALTDNFKGLPKGDDEVDFWIGQEVGKYFLVNPSTKGDEEDKEKTAAGTRDDTRISISSNNNGGGDSNSKPQPPPPPHLLGLLRDTMTRRMRPEDRRLGRKRSTASGGTCGNLQEIDISPLEGHPQPTDKDNNPSLLRLSSGAVSLSQIGVELTASENPWFADVELRRGHPLFGKLSLSPLFLNEMVARILVNIVALEVAQATTNAGPHWEDGFVVSSYLSVLAMLMDREEDVQQLRESRVLYAHFSNQQTIAFFKVLAKHLRLGYNYFDVVDQIDGYIKTRKTRATFNTFVYKYGKLIVSVLSVISVLIGVFKAFYAAQRS